MSKIYLINVGANDSHSSNARSPRFADGSFLFVPIPWTGPWARKYPPKCRPFVRVTTDSTHDDPDWPNLTFGDDCSHSRAGNLQRVTEGDILLFWGMLWDNIGSGWLDFTGQKGWYLLGALRVNEILGGGQRPKNARPENIGRARRNVHFKDGPLPHGHRVFIGDSRYSTLFPRAVDLGGTRRDGLVYRTMRDKNGNALVLDGTAKFYSYLRTCRAMWDLDVPQNRRAALTVRDAIQRDAAYDLFADIHF
jgi:hypothetical protein